jgi:hypothetical protein
MLEHYPMAGALYTSPLIEKTEVEVVVLPLNAGAPLLPHYYVDESGKVYYVKDPLFPTEVVTKYGKELAVDTLFFIVRADANKWVQHYMKLFRRPEILEIHPWLTDITDLRYSGPYKLNTTYFESNNIIWIQ